MLLSLAVAYALQCGSAEAQYHFTSWTVENGLPQNSITAIHQSRDGYLWIATLDGLARFDGVRFVVFNRTTSPGISSNRFTALYEDRHGEMWLGTEAGNVTRYAGGRFVSYSDAHGLPMSFVRGFTGDAAGNVWVLSGETISQWQASAERFAETSAPRAFGGYQRVLWSQPGGFWGVNDSGLHLFVDGQWEPRALPPSAPGLPTAIARGQDGAIWAAFAGSGVVRLDQPTANDRQTRWRDRAGTVWSMEVGDRLRRSLTLTSAGRVETLPFDISFEDREGNLWLGSDGQGLHRVRKETIATYSTPHGLVDGNIYPIYQDRSGAIWVGAWSGGLSRYIDGRFTSYTTKDGLAPGAITAFAEDRHGTMWIGTQSGVQQFRDGRFTAVLDHPVPAAIIVNVIHEDRSGAMWFGTDEGLLRYHDGVLSRFTTRDGLANNNVRVIIDGESGLWIGCYGGLTQWRDGRFTSWTERDGLPGNMVRALYEDREGVLWIGSYESGLGRFHRGTFTRYTTRDGLFDDGVFQVLEDSRGHLWMSSNRGISRVRKQELQEFADGRRREITSVGYGRADGMRNVECNGGLWPAGIRARDGRLWFPTQDGAAVIDPDAVAGSGPPPSVVIESLMVDRAPVDAPLSDAPVRIAPDQQNVEIHYTGLSFGDPERMRFRYRLAGLDDDWIEAGTRRTAYYSHAPPGRYVFTVVAANADGEWTSSGATLRLDVLPPFYRTWWFLTAAALAVASLLLGGYTYRIAQLTRAQAAQQAFSRQLIAAQERERQRIAGELHDSLGQSLAIIKNRALLSLSTPDDHDRARDQLQEIAGAASDVISEVKEIAHNLRPYQLDRLGLTKTIEGTVRTIESTQGLPFTVEVDRIDGLLAPDAEINLFRIIQESTNNIVKHAGATQAAVRVRKKGRTIDVTIEDNGRGFDQQSRVAVEQKRGGFGLIGMSERARLLGAEHRVRSTPGGGTTVTLSIDLEDQGWPLAASE